MSDKKILQSVVRAFSILELLDECGELGITEISEKLSLEKSTVFRTISTLKSLGYVVQNPSNSKYSNSYKLFEIGSNVARKTGLPKMAYPFMLDMSRITGEAVNLAVRDGSKALYISKIESTDTIKVCMNLGQTIPLYCTALGKSLIAFLPENSIRELLCNETFVQYTSNTITDMEALLKDLEVVRKRGYSIDDEEHIKNIYCIAAPVFDASGSVIAALSIALPKFRFDENPKREELYSLVRDTARRFSCSLGWQGNVMFEESR
jgi:IclR family KDG regulon transcriptional repressor